MYKKHIIKILKIFIISLANYRVVGLFKVQSIKIYNYNQRVTRKITLKDKIRT